MVALTRLLEDLAEISKVVMLVGNHDMLNNQQYCSDMHPFVSMAHISGVDVVDRPVVLGGDGCKQVALICAPFLPTGMFQQALDEHLPGEWKDWRNRTDDCVIFAHQEFKGANMGNMIVSTGGDVYQEDWPRVFSGHIHERQIVGDSVLYVGTPWSTSFTGTCKKTVSILRFARGGKRLSAYEEDTIELTTAPKRRVHSIMASDLGTLTLEDGVCHKVVLIGSRGELKVARSDISLLSNSSDTWKRALVDYRIGSKPLEPGQDSTCDQGDSSSLSSLIDIQTEFRGSTMSRLSKLIGERNNGPELLTKMKDVCDKYRIT